MTDNRTNEQIVAEELADAGAPLMHSRVEEAVVEALRTAGRLAGEPNKYAGFLARQNHQRDPWRGIGTKCLCGKVFDLDADHALHQVDEILGAALEAAALVAAGRERDAVSDAATEERIDRWMLLVGKAVEERMTAEAERDAALAAIERAAKKIEAVAGGTTTSSEAAGYRNGLLRAAQIVRAALEGAMLARPSEEDIRRAAGLLYTIRAGRLSTIAAPRWPHKRDTEEHRGETIRHGLPKDREGGGGGRVK